MTANTAVLNVRRVRYANNRYKHPRAYYNCWGATLFVLGHARILQWIECGVMRRWLEENTEPIHRPRKPGDIVAVYGWGLEHTAVYLGNGKYFHKMGSNRAEITDLAGVRKIYDGKYEFKRVREIA